MRIATNSAFKISSNRFIVTAILSPSAAAAAGFVFFLIGKDDGER